jgi:nitrous oxidase accessory protein
MDAGVFVEKSAAGALVEENRIEGNLYGIYLHGAENAVARKNEIVGIDVGRVNEAGNGVSVWNAPGAKVLDNDIRFGRDGIFVIASQRNVFSGNRLRDLRFAIHYMYTNDSEVSNNISTGNTVGFAIMYSHHLKVRANVSDGDRDRGFLFNFANGSGLATRSGTAPAGGALGGGARPRQEARAWRRSDQSLPSAWAPAGRNVFIYNANQNVFREIGLKAVKSAFISPPGRRVMRSRATRS